MDVFVSVAEESADIHAAALVRAVRGRMPDLAFYGLTGPRLRGLGVETVYDFASHAAMLSGVLEVIGHARRAVKAVGESWRQRRPDLIVLLDSPELHLRLARQARKLGIPVLYYIAPQTWASRAGRNRRIARDVTRLACILPFEEEYFRRQGVTAEYVGHPLFETLRSEQPIADTVSFLKARADGRPIVALLPGSRRHVIDAMLPKQLEVVSRLCAGGKSVYAAISCVSEERREQIRGLLGAWTPDTHGENPHPTLPLEGGGVRADDPHPALPLEGGGVRADDPRPGLPLGGGGAASTADAGIDVVVADNASLLNAADLVLVASGTAALHVAYYRKPMVVMYDAGRLLALPYRLFGRMVLKTPHLSLVNILAGARVVPEFMPFIADLAPVAAVARQLLEDETWRGLMVSQLDKLVRPLGGGQASENVSRMMGELLART